MTPSLGWLSVCVEPLLVTCIWLALGVPKAIVVPPSKLLAAMFLSDESCACGGRSMCAAPGVQAPGDGWTAPLQPVVGSCIHAEAVPSSTSMRSLELRPKEIDEPQIRSLSLVWSWPATASELPKLASSHGRPANVAS